MSGLQVNTGLISGINYVELVDQLIKVDSLAKENLVTRTETLALEREALGELQKRFLQSTYMIRTLNSATSFQKTEAKSSNDSLIRVSQSGNPAVGNYTFTPLQMATSQQSVASGVASDTEALGKTGTITIGKGWSVENDVKLSDINGGQGFVKGSIRITDANGFRTTVNLSKAQTIDDVVNAINDNDSVDVVAELDGDKLVLRDVSGNSDLSKFAIQEVSGGTTAASLGLVGAGSNLDSATGVLTGNTIWRLGESMSLSLLNDGNGVVFNNTSPDFSIKTRDGKTVVIDFNRVVTSEDGTTRNEKEITVGDLLNTINHSAGSDGVTGKVTARISDDGKGIVLEDNTTGNGLTEIIPGVSTSPILKMLGFTDSSSANSVTMLSNYLNGKTPAAIAVQSKAMSSAVEIELDSTDLAAVKSAIAGTPAASGSPAVPGVNPYTAIADKLNEKMAAEGVDLEFRINSTNNGFTVIDTSGGTGNIVISDSGGSGLASQLGLTSLTSGDLQSALEGVEPGTIQFLDRNEKVTEITVTAEEIDAFTDIQSVADLFNTKLDEATQRFDNETEPGFVKFTDSAGNSATIEITQADLDNVDDHYDITTLLNDKINGTGVGIHFNNNTRGRMIIEDVAAGGGSMFIEPQDGNGDPLIANSIAHYVGIDGEYEPGVYLPNETSHVGRFDPPAMERIQIEADVVDGALVFRNTFGSSGTMSISQQGVTNPADALTARLGVEQSTPTTASEVAGLSFGDVMADGETFSVGTFESRDLIGGLDTVLVSTLNGGNGFKGEPGVIEVQDRSGHQATINISQADIDSMNTLSDAVKLFNSKLTDAGVNISVKINDTKTGLDVVDTSGSSAHNLIFKDKELTAGTPAVPETAAVNAVSGNNGTGGTAVLTFTGTHLMNGMTFGFTDDNSESGYDSATKTFTFYVDPSATPTDTAVQTAINSQIASVWDDIAEDLSLGDVDPPTAAASTGLAAQAIADAASGGKTAISSTYGTQGVTHVPVVPAVPGSGADIATSFGLNVDSASSSVSGTSLNKQIVSHSTLLSDLNGGSGVTVTGGKFTITDSTKVNRTDSSGKVTQVPNTWTFTIDTNKHKTVGDIIDEINRVSSLKVTARINDEGTGILLEEFGGGDGTFAVADADGTSKFAATMGIVGSVAPQDRDENNRGFIKSSETHSIEVVETDSLEDIRKKINDLNAGYSASIFVDGSDTPYRLSVSSSATGAAGAFNLDLSAIGITSETMNEAQDAMITYGGANGLTLSSKTNSFKGVVSGIDLTVTGTSDSPVTITSESSSVTVKVALEEFVKAYNSFREYLNAQSNYAVNDDGQVLVDPDGGNLWNSSIAKSFDREITSMLQKGIEGIPGIYSLADLGITVRSNYDDYAEGGAGANAETNTLIFDADKFQAAWDRDREAVEKFFYNNTEITDSADKKTTISYGWSQKFTDLADTFVGSGSSLGRVQSRIDSLTSNIDRSTERATYLQERLDWKRQMYLNQFYAMEQAMAKMTKDSNAVAGIASSWSSNYSASG